MDPLRAYYSNPALHAVIPCDKPSLFDRLLAVFAQVRHSFSSPDQFSFQTWQDRRGVPAYLEAFLTQPISLAFQMLYTEGRQAMLALSKNESFGRIFKIFTSVSNVTDEQRGQLEKHLWELCNQLSNDLKIETTLIPLDKLRVLCNEGWSHLQAVQKSTGVDRQDATVIHLCVLILARATMEAIFDALSQNPHAFPVQSEHDGRLDQILIAKCVSQQLPRAESDLSNLAQIMAATLIGFPDDADPIAYIVDLLEPFAPINANR